MSEAHQRSRSKRVYIHRLDMPDDSDFDHIGWAKTKTEAAEHARSAGYRVDDDSVVDDYDHYKVGVSLAGPAK